MKEKGLQILLIDDTAIILESLREILSASNFISRTEMALSAEEGLALMEAYHPDVLVLDINLPGMNGIEMLKRLQGSENGKPVIIMLTNNAHARYKEECLRMGADFFLDKARDFPLITSIIEKVNKGTEAMAC